MVELRSTSSSSSSPSSAAAAAAASGGISSRIGDGAADNSHFSPSARSKSNRNQQQRTATSPTSRRFSTSSCAPMLRYFSLYLLFLAFSAQSGSAELVPNYDNADQQLIVFDDRLTKPLVISCNIVLPSSGKLSWTRNGVDVSEDKQLKGRYEIQHANNALVIKPTDEKDAGTYTCSLSATESKTINVVANTYIKNMPNSQAVVEGEKLTITCVVFGTDPKISWSVGNATFNTSTGHYLLSENEEGIANAVLTIESATLDDRAYYNCTAVNQATGLQGFHPEVESVYVRVKGKLAALWPFLGICAEVFVLCAIILVYEKRRNKAELDESDTDQSPEQEKLKEKK